MRKCAPCISSHLLLIKYLSQPVNLSLKSCLSLATLSQPSLCLLSTFWSFSQCSLRKTFIFHFPCHFFFFTALTVPSLPSCAHWLSFPLSPHNVPFCTDYDCCLPCWVRDIIWHRDKSNVFHLHLSSKSEKILAWYFSSPTPILHLLALTWSLIYMKLFSHSRPTTTSPPKTKIKRSSFITSSDSPYHLSHSIWL